MVYSIKGPRPRGQYRGLSMGEELWAQIVEFPDYAVSSHGQIKSLRFDRLLKPRPNSYGHERVALYRGNERHDVYVHHLVAAAFTTGWEPGVQVRHADGNKSNNDVYNFRFPSGRRMGQMVKNPQQPTVRHVRIVGTDHIFRTVEDCANFLGGDPSSIYRVLRGNRLSHKGYQFEYLEE